MRLDLYVNHRGTCEDAFRFYEQHLGGRVTGLVRHGSQPNPNSAYLTLTLDGEADAERVYALLTDGGEIFMEMEKTPFANRFAMLRDRFGTSWMLLHQPEAV